MSSIRQIITLCLGSLLIVQWACPGIAATRYMSHQEIQSLIELGEAALQDGDNIEAASLLLKAKLQAEESRHQDLLYLADVDLGSVYFNLDEIGESMFYFQEALSLTESNNMDWEHRYTALNGIAGSYYRQKDYKRAKEIIDQCLEAAQAEHDSVAIVDFSLNLVRITTHQNNQSQALFYDSTLNANLTAEYTEMIRPYLYDVEMEMYYNHKQYDKAREKARFLLDSCDYATGNASALFTLCRIAKEEGDYAEALNLARQALRNSSHTRKRTLYDLMSSIYMLINKPQLAMECKDSALMWSDSAQFRADTQLLQQSQVQSEASRIRHEFQEQKEQLATSRQMMVLCVLLFMGIIAFGLWYFYRQRGNVRNERLRSEQAQREQELALKQKNQELLIATQITSARNEVVSDLLSSLQKINGISQNPEVKSLMSNLRQQLGDSNRQDDFLIRFQQSHPDFVEKLLARHPDLLDSDLRFLSYILQRLPQSDIASLLNITPDSCKRRKIRISKKLGLQSSTELYEYLCTLMS